MPEEKTTGTQHHSLTNTDLAFERTTLAYERTLMAWIRTAISLISFGFTIYKFLGEIKKTPGQHEELFTPRIVGMVMILFGLLSLFLAQMQHRIAMKKLKQDYSGAQKSISSVLGILILIFGLVLFLAALFRQ